MGNQAFTLRDSVILNRSVWERMTPQERLGLLAHEITHSVQYQGLGPTTDFLARYAPEYGRGDINYEVGETLSKIELKNLNPVDHRFTLDQIAEHVKNKVMGISP